MITFPCGFSLKDQQNQDITLVPIKGSKHNFQLKLKQRDNLCLEERDGKAVYVKQCTEGTYWKWTSDALLEWSGGGCLTSSGMQAPILVQPCDQNEEIQIMEIGVVEKACIFGPCTS